MQSTAATPEQYIDELPEHRKAIIITIRKAIKDNLPKGFEEVVGYGMLGYVVPHAIYPAGYHCNPKLPLPFINVASQKSHISIHHLGLYASKPMIDWLTEEWGNYSAKKMDMGKGCLRFKKAEDVPLKLIEKLAKKMSVQQWIDIYESNLKNRK
jgi:hypothetical protein